MSIIPSVRESEKTQLRELAKLARAKAWQRHGQRAGRLLSKHGLEFLSLEGPKTISGFRAIGEEIDPEPLLLRLAQKGHSLALPVIIAKAQPLEFRAWRPGDPLAKRQWGIEEPFKAAEVVNPDVLLVPLLGFDGRGYRVGYGGGFYDRSLAKLRLSKSVISVGLAFDEQMVDAVPHLDYDERLDWMLTPSGPLRCSD